ncbi:transposase [Bradyrhizobium sp. 87]|uniref:transposase n=1 Tax=Bradyrhizobium sp. 87 TaxID=2782682 RepID=UPI001FF79A01|nr:transposase [Bradyrhizobium sp. 87]MCK1431070.1 transposase [Bradyrhizobium sp. 87]
MEKPAELTPEQLAKPLHTGDLPGLMAAIAPTIAECVAAQLKPLRARILELEKGGGVRYEGVWQAPRSYSRGAWVTFDGGVFHCNADSTRDKPGSSSAWTLAIKSGVR